MTSLTDLLAATERVTDPYAIIRRDADSMNLFARDDKIFYGKWRQWKRASSQEEADKILAEFRQGK